MHWDEFYEFCDAHEEQVPGVQFHHTQFRRSIHARKHTHMHARLHTHTHDRTQSRMHARTHNSRAYAHTTSLCSLSPPYLAADNGSLEAKLRRSLQGIHYPHMPIAKPESSSSLIACHYSLHFSHDFLQVYVKSVEGFSSFAGFMDKCGECRMKTLECHEMKQEASFDRARLLSIIK